MRPGYETRNTAAGLLTGYKKHVACHEGEAEMRDNVLLFWKKMMQGTSYPQCSGGFRAISCSALTISSPNR
ncbi:hypothetical protein Lspi_2711 [Legionella spiritensis]|uniref:Uncharacterized protein n=1 Tax=Legionella spiritensis TaxID=452 RepID=A0A0W0YWZ9_LEGSP|nr:hypothetical protein Lspi_2711 [Legionella spiritensis]SNV44830.1 Uncharacterised protein [Legionella spiritensis]